MQIGAIVSFANIIYFRKYVDDPTVLSDAEFDLELDIMRKNVNEIYDDDKENDVNVENISPLKKRKVDNSQVKEIKNISPRKLQTSNNNKRSATKQKPKEKKKDLKAKKVNIVIIWLVYCGAFRSIEVKAPLCIGWRIFNNKFRP